MDELGKIRLVLIVTSIKIFTYRKNGDRGCDLAHPDFPISDWDIGNGRKIRPKIFIHHLNPLTKEDILQHSDNLFDPENVVCVAFKTHNIIHYGHEGSKKIFLPDFSDRTPFDTCPWRKGVL